MSLENVTFHTQGTQTALVFLDPLDHDEYRNRPGWTNHYYFCLFCETAKLAILSDCSTQLFLMLPAFAN